MKKLYLVVRADLEPGAQLAQSNHATAAFAVGHPDEFRHWATVVQDIAVLAIPNEAALRDLMTLADRKGVPYAGFHEPDFGDELTALALGAGAEKITSSLPLALKVAKQRAA